MKKVFIILVLAGSVCACSAKIGNTKMGSSESAITEQMKDVKTKADARSTFGTPNLIFDRNTAEVYEYRKITGSGRYHWLIPVVGWMTTWWQDSYTYRETNLFIAFDKNDKIIDWNVIKTGGTTD